jgi:hypothetical protein
VELLTDTSPEAAERLLRWWVGALNRTAKALAQARQDTWYPHATPEERRLRLASLWIAREDMIRWWGWDPDLRGR